MPFPGLDSDLRFIQTPAAKPSKYGTPRDCGITLADMSLSIIAMRPRLLPN